MFTPLPGTLTLVTAASGFYLLLVNGDTGGTYTCGQRLGGLHNRYYSFMVLEARGLSSRSLQGWFLVRLPPSHNKGLPLAVSSHGLSAIAHMKDTESPRVFPT